MAIDLDPTTAGPVFASQSRVNTDTKDFGTFTASSQQALLDRIVDGDPFSAWFSADAVSTETIDLTVQTKTAKVAKPIDFFALQNINWKNFKVEWKAGAGAFAIIPGFDFTGSDNAETDLVKTFASISPDTYKITVTTTTDADLKKLGGIYACLKTLQLSENIGGMDKYDKVFREKVRLVRLGDNAISREFIFRSATSYEHFGAAVRFNLLTRAERDLMRGIKRAGDPFTFFPEPGEVNRDLFTCQFKGVWRDKYVSTFKGTGYQIGASIEELGSL